MDDLLALLTQLATSPWVYLLILVAVAVDAFLPVVPGESVVITAGVFATSGAPDPVLVILAAAVGAYLGDQVSYVLGSGARSWTARLRSRPRAARRLRWAQRQLVRHGGLVLVVARFVPGGRTLTNLAAGALAYPRHRFGALVAAGGVCWAAYTMAIGYVGGTVFADDPLRALLAGLLAGSLVTVVVEAVRRMRSRSLVRR